MGRYYLADDKATAGDSYGNLIYREENPGEFAYEFPKNPCREIFEDCAFVDDFGAVGDGVTDSTDAIRRAMNSGAHTVLFGDGAYYIDGGISIPASVRVVDFNFCQLVSSPRLISGEMDCTFEICEGSEEMLFVENLYTQEQFYGHMRLLKQSAVRDVVLSDLQTSMACLYFNTVGGSRLYLDNIFLTTGTYCDDRVLKRKGFAPVFSKNIPLELHGQTVIGRGVNLERAEVAILNDGSELLLDGFRTEGPGTAIRTINGGRTTVHVFQAGIGDRTGKRPLFEAIDSTQQIFGARAFGYNERSEYHIIVREVREGKETFVLWDELPESTRQHSKILDRFESEQ